MSPDRIRQRLDEAAHDGRILASARDHCLPWLDPTLFESWVISAIEELVEEEHWGEINDRFYRSLAFGTGGLRGRTIGRVVTRAERDGRPTDACPARPAVGSNCMNDFNVRRATMGLTQYLRRAAGAASPHVVFAHDTRHFSRHFAELAARTVIACGGRATLFEAERSTPELSFAVRELNADAGVVLTASHNPSHDNGFKAYFSDGAQVVEPHASGIIAEVNGTPTKEVCRLKETDAASVSIGHAMDEAYLARLLTLVVEPKLVKEHGKAVKIVYSALHGTGGRIVPEALRRIGATVLEVPSQKEPDGRFPTVASPNPENAEALAMGIALAEKEGADVVMATDPDADRMGVAVRGSDGKMMLLTGNQIGSMLAYFRLERLFAQGILNKENRSRARLVKTVVTTDLQKAIAAKFSVPIPETLTGFKYIGEKLEKYERIARGDTMDAAAYRRLSETEKRDLHLRRGAWYVFGGEESYGYSASDFTRDKDANAACVIFAELAISARAKGLSLPAYLDSLFSEMGYYREKLGQLVYQGAEGAARIQAILKSYAESPPREMGGQAVVKVTNHNREPVKDCEGDLLPREMLFFVDLADGNRYAVRGSGTEPKIKFYLFGREKPPSGKRFEAAQLATVKVRVDAGVEALWRAIEADARRRAGEC
jgi:phosphoglucomutase